MIQKRLQDLLRSFDPYPFRDFRDGKETNGLKGVEKGHTFTGSDGRSYDIRNSLNNLSSKEWTFFLNTLETTNYPTLGNQSYGHSLRRLCPSPKPPQLMEKIVRFFTKEGGWVLDPFMGVGGILLGASMCKRNAVGIDISQEYIERYYKVSKTLGLKKQIAEVCDARNILEFCEDTGEFFDLILTDPPYCNIQARKKTGELARRRGEEPTPFTKDPRDIGNLDYEPFIEELTTIVEKTLACLKPGKYLVMFTKDIQPTEKHHNMLHADIVSAMLRIDRLRFRGYKIWFDKAQNLYPYGYPFQYVGNQFHQFIMIFSKSKQ
jgi:hypothetical protein